ncbi:hypothetical protein [Paenibacillus sp. P13VS]|uniref:hypothetical protein n=1 Tax=Paenibacillus sp. P13VS TaxID=2697367 RepID=UPI00187B6EAE|nr:hypothetical protein [Paenibacillus sp. P13VS]MBE7680125.1 hypothetical protein [Paenibacillus sp. P13VS]
MKGDDVGFYGNENHNPLDRFGVEHSGGIISAAAGFAIDSFKASIVDSQGQEVRNDRRFGVLVSEGCAGRVQRNG